MPGPYTDCIASLGLHSQQHVGTRHPVKASPVRVVLTPAGAYVYLPVWLCPYGGYEGSVKLSSWGQQLHFINGSDGEQKPARMMVINLPVCWCGESAKLSCIQCVCMYASIRSPGAEMCVEGLCDASLEAFFCMQVVNATGVCGGAGKRPCEL